MGSQSEVLPRSFLCTRASGSFGRRINLHGHGAVKEMSPRKAEASWTQNQSGCDDSDKNQADSLEGRLRLFLLGAEMG